MHEQHSSDSITPAGAGFGQTHWSVVLAAGSPDSAHARIALESLCQAYWRPIYAYVRRQGYSAYDSQDLVQEFFARLLEKDTLADACPTKGRFRSFILASLKHFLANEWDKANAQKRGGGCTIVSIESETAESGYSLEPVESLTAEKIFERRWALTLLERVLQRLEQEHASSGKQNLFSALKHTLTGEGRSMSYAKVGEELGLSEGAVKVAVHRLRQRYRQLLREEIAHTVPGPDLVEGEIRALFAALAN